MREAKGMKRGDGHYTLRVSEGRTGVVDTVLGVESSPARLGGYGAAVTHEVYPESVLCLHLGYRTVGRYADEGAISSLSS